MDLRLRRLLPLAVLLLAACSGGGKKDDDAAAPPAPPVVLGVDEVVIGGRAVNPGTGALVITVDGEPATIAADTWLYTVRLDGATEHTVTVACTLDGVLLSSQEVRVRQAPP